MTPETLEFWKMFFQSPIVATLIGGLVGAFATFPVTYFKLRHDTKENEKTWQREESRRKEERAFKKKTVTYEKFFSCFDDIQNKNLDTLYYKFIPVAMNLMTYGPIGVKVHTRKSIEIMMQLIKQRPESLDNSPLFKKLQYHCDEIHTEIMKDIDIHFSRNDIEQWEDFLKNTENKEMNSD